MKWRAIAVVASAVGALLGSAAAAQAQGVIATIQRPATLPLRRSPEAGAAAGGFKYVDIAVTGFHPSSTGPVQIVVDAQGRGGRIEVGRFGLYPEHAFSGDPAKVQRFTLNIPEGLRVTPATRLSVRLEPARGTGEGASVKLDPGLLR
jgi:hypothetical protein